MCVYGGCCCVCVSVCVCVCDMSCVCVCLCVWCVCYREEQQCCDTVHAFKLVDGVGLQCPPQLLAPLVNMSKTGYKKYVFAVYPLGLSLKIFTKILPFH